VVLKELDFLKRWKFWLGVLISLIFLYVGLRGLHVGQVWSEIRQASYGWLLPAILIYFVAVWGRALRWYYLLRPIEAVPLKELFPIVVIGYMGNNIYPARAGELIRAYVLRKRHRVSISASLATIIVERIFDGVVMLLFVFAALPFTPMPTWLQQAVLIGGAIFGGALIVFFALAFSPILAAKIYGWFIDRLIPGRFREPVRGFADRFMEGLYALRSGRDVAMIFLVSPLIWLTETVVYWLLMQGFDFQVPFYALMLMSGVVNLATTIPSSPGYVGTFDALGIKVLEGFNVAGSIAAGYTLALHATLWLPITLLGAFFMWRESIGWRELAEAEKLQEQEAT
jgi:hypothetical protein